MSRKRNATGASGPAEALRRTAAQRSLAVLPTLCTLGNCLCGFLAVFFASRKPETQMAWNWTPLTVAAAFVFTWLFSVTDKSAGVAAEQAGFEAQFVQSELGVAVE